MQALEVATMAQKKSKKTSDMYDDEEAEELMENDEISPGEAGFMEGYKEKQRKGKKLKDMLDDK